MKILFFLSLVLTLAGCGSGKQTSITEDTAAIDTSSTDGTLVDSSEPLQTSDTTAGTAIKSFKGFYISGNELSTFRDCSGKVYWVEDESKRLTETYKKALGFLPYPYESIYVELKGYLKGKSKLGYAAEYENVLVVTEVESAVQKTFSSDCFAYEFIALGNEPFWSLDIIPSEQIIALKDVGVEKTFVFPYKAAQKSGSSFVYETLNGKKDKIKIVITKETCSDGMSDRTYSYSAQVTINGKMLKGCAIRKGDKLSGNH